MPFLDLYHVYILYDLTYLISSKKLTRTYQLGVSNIEIFHANKMACFTCYLSHICISWKICTWIIFKCFKLLLYMFITRVQSLGTRFRHQVGHRGYYKGGGHR